MLGGLNEFNSAVRHGLDLIVVLCNDGSYGPEHMMLVEWGFSPEIIEFEWPDFGPVATALGGEGLTVRTEEDLDKACELIANRTKPVLIDLKLDPYAMPGIPH
jgi:thiamine pyrophosphate-dependent acetolactate synthase large subunit-like protein